MASKLTVVIAGQYDMFDDDGSMHHLSKTFKIPYDDVRLQAYFTRTVETPEGPVQLTVWNKPDPEHFDKSKPNPYPIADATVIFADDVELALNMKKDVEPHVKNDMIYMVINQSLNNNFESNDLENIVLAGDQPFVELATMLTTKIKKVEN